MAKLGVNVDHIATVRQARRTIEPDPVAAATLSEKAGAHCITVHLREDRRHIQDEDVKRLRKSVRTKLNLEMANVSSIVQVALRIRPDQATIVPEKREEVTTEGGLDVVKYLPDLQGTVAVLQKGSINVSLFVDPIPSQIEASAQTGAKCIELHTGAYANAKNEAQKLSELDTLIRAAKLAAHLGLRVNAGHGINYENAKDLLRIPKLDEVNIGHSIVSRAIFVGIEEAVREMAQLLEAHEDSYTR